MYVYIARRFLQAIPVMVLVATAVFLLLRLTPGDPTDILLGPEATPERAAELRRDLGLDQPLPVQWAVWFGHVIRGDLGESIFLRRPVTQAIWERAEPTLMLTFLSLIIAVTLGLSLGIAAAVRQGSWADLLAMLVSLAGISMPTFWIGLNLILVFAVILGLLPVAGYKPLSEGVWENVRYLLLPAVTLGFYDAALLARMTRSMMLGVLKEHYVRTARSIGVSERRVVLRAVAECRGRLAFPCDLGSLVDGHCIDELRRQGRRVRIVVGVEAVARHATGAERQPRLVSEARARGVEADPPAVRRRARGSDRGQAQNEEGGEFPVPFAHASRSHSISPERRSQYGHG